MDPRTELQFIPISEFGFAEWDRLCLESESAWFWHTSLFQKYLTILYPHCEIQSFVVLVNKKAAALVPLMISNNQSKEFKYGGWSLPFPAFADHADIEQTELVRIILDRFDKLAKEHGVARLSLLIYPQQKSLYSKFIEKSVFYDHGGFCEHTEQSLAADFSCPPEDFVRKRFLQYIRKHSPNFQFSITERNSTEERIRQEFTEVSLKDTSQVYKENVIDCMFDFFGASDTFLIRAATKDTNQAVGFLFILFYKKMAFDFAVYVDDSYKSERISHMLKLEALRALDDRNCTLYELGLKSETPHLNRIPSPKGTGISDFKKGFSNKELPLKLGERFYDLNFFKQTFLDRIDQLFQSQQGESHEP